MLHSAASVLGLHCLPMSLLWDARLKEAKFRLNFTFGSYDQKKSDTFNPFSLLFLNNTYANSVDPEERAHNEQSHQDPHCLPF